MRARRHCLAWSQCLIDGLIILKCFPKHNQVCFYKRKFLFFLKKKIKIAFGRKRKWNSPLKWTWRILEGLFQVVIKHLWSKFAHFCPHQSYNIPGIKAALEFKNKTVEQTELEVLGRHSPPAECSFNWWYRNKKEDVYFFCNLPFFPFSAASCISLS